VAEAADLNGQAREHQKEGERKMLRFETEWGVVLEYDGDDFIWFHPRVAAVPSAAGPGEPAVVMTIQKHLQVSDFYSGLHSMRSEDLGRSWTPPAAHPELEWRKEPSGVTVSVCDVTPNWHPGAGKVVAFGAQVRYSPEGHQIEDRYRSRQTAYTVHDPQSGSWTEWRVLEVPSDEEFDLCRSACAQWLTEPDGTLLVPSYHARNQQERYSVTVMRLRFDDGRVECIEVGNRLSLDAGRGLCEPSLARFRDRYFLTLRNDAAGYVSVSDDGLGYEPIREWTFDDGAELGSYNTQQHWLAHSEGLFLVYTRRGANNDHVMRHRAPLLIAQVDPDKLCVVRETEQILIPEHGAPMGNFGAAEITAKESWVTVSEFMWPDWDEEARRGGAAGRTLLARVLWDHDNRSISDSLIR